MGWAKACHIAKLVVVLICDFLVTKAYIRIVDGATLALTGASILD